MKRLIAGLVLFVSLFVVAIAQNNNFEVREIKVNVDEKGVPDGTYSVNMRDGTTRYINDSGWENNVTWYLSYKGKRVSDYYHSVARSMSWFTVKSVAWPNEVPKGHEKYVTVQFGKEPEKKDRRDDR